MATLSRWCTLSAFLVEVVFFLYKTGESMLDATVRPYIVTAVCRNLYAANASLLCPELSRFPEVESHVQREAALYLMYHRVLVNVPAVLLGLFCGAWSDRYGRKLPMMIPSVGSVSAVVAYLLSLQQPGVAVQLLLVGAAVQGLLGKSSVITMAVNSYVADTTDKEERTRKLGKLLAMNFFGLFSGSLLAGALQDAASLQTTFVVAGCMHVLAVLMVALCLEETVTPAKSPDGEGHGHGCCSLFNVVGVRDSVMVIFRKRADGVRLVLVTLFLTSVVNQTCKVGESDVTVLFVQRSPLNWQQSWYGYLQAVDYACMGLSLLLVLPVLSTFLHLNDVIIVLISIVFRLVRAVWAGFCTQTWMVYTSVVIGSMAGMLMSAVRSLMSKNVEEHEVGKMFSVLASAETASKLFGTLIFTNIYAATVDLFAGFAYLVVAFVFFILFFVTLWMYKEMKMEGTYNLLLAFATKQDKEYGTSKGDDRKTDTISNEKTEVDELEANPTILQPLPATTP